MNRTRPVTNGQAGVTGGEARAGGAQPERHRGAAVRHGDATSRSWRMRPRREYPRR
ncbi:MAG TPA: hypothetical protein VFB46_00945 [Gemmatimonadaceae bacterium]|nr:hypothetical protein [Gemmatimonadaceae bacterium]